MRHWRGICLWETLATAASVMLLLWVTRIYLQHPQSFHVLEPESHGVTCSSARPCVRKCCPRGQELQQPNPNLTSGCYPASVSHFTISEIPQDNGGSAWTNDTFDIVYENCVKINPEKEGDSVLLLADGSVKINEEDVYSVSEYCIDFKKDKTYVFLCSHEEERAQVSECFVLGYMVSAGCLLLTTVVYLVISVTPHVRQRLQINSTHLTVLLNYLPTLFFAYVLLSVIYENPLNLNTEHHEACRAIGE